MIQVGEKDIQLGDIGQAATGGLRHGLEVFKHPDNIGFHVTSNHFHGVWYQRNLAGEVNRVTNFHCLGIGADRLRGFIGADDFASHDDSPVG